MRYDLLSSTPPAMPKRLPEFVEHAISKVPEIMRPAAAMGMFAPAGAQMHDVAFRYTDNRLHEPVFMAGCIAGSSMGKGYLDDLYEAMVRSLREHDKETRRKIDEWTTICNTKGGSKDKPPRPTDAAILVPEPDMTKPSLILLFCDAEREGNRRLYSMIPELDLLNTCCGTHKNVSKLIRVNFDTKRYGAQRATPNGVSGNPYSRWNFNFATTPEMGQNFFKDCLTNGTLGRMFIAYVPRPAENKQPIQGNYDQEYQDKLEFFLDKLRKANGEIETPELMVLVEKISTDFRKLDELTEDDDFSSFWHRSLVMSWMVGCLLYIANDYKWSHELAEFVEWVMYYDLWSKIALFFVMIRNDKIRMIRPDNKNTGPKNMLDMLPDSFAKDQLVQLRESRGMEPECEEQLKKWRSRKYIIYCKQTGLYTKTDAYLRKHPQKS